MGVVCCDFGQALIPILLGLSLLFLVPGIVAAVWCVRNGHFARAIAALAVPVPAGWLGLVLARGLGFDGSQALSAMLAAPIVAAYWVVRGATDDPSVRSPFG